MFTRVGSRWNLVAATLLAAVVGCAGTAASGQQGEQAPEQTAVDGGSGDDGSDVSPPGDSSAADGGPRDAASGDAGANADGAGPSGCIDSVAPGHHVYKCDGIAMDVEIPAQCSTPRACGLVVDSHGLTMSAQMEDDNTQLRALGGKYGFVIVQPNANPAPPQASWNTATDDPILYAFIVRAIPALAVDPSRVHMTGFSDGGDATFRFLCSHAELFASVAPAAGNGCTFKPGDMPAREVPVLYMHGTRDALMDFQTTAIPQRDAVVAGWQMGQGQVVEQGSGYVRTRWTSARGTVFELLQHDYAAANGILVGHCYPGSTDTGSQPGQLFSFACVPPNAFTWGEEVMKFFVAKH